MTGRLLKPGLSVPIAVVVASWVLPTVAVGVARKTAVGRVLTGAAAATALELARSLRQRG